MLLTKNKILIIISYIMMRKCAFLLIICCLLLFTLFACKSQKIKEDIEASPTPVTETAPTATPAKKDSQFTVSEEIHSQTYSEINELIAKLNQVIANKDFSTWKTYLTDTYIQKFSSRSTLNIYSNSPLMKKYNIQLTDLNDYFRYVVVPSREEASLHSIEFKDKNKVIAYTKIKDKLIILYKLEKTNNQWKISTW